ncbi:hypothetical protein [Haloferula sargassicola]|uniref:Uncharacterized protein n=1 Tax=Haloferula sargassicola TaxID=490096 RepID=A0ABP9UR71_9BACT
MLKNPLALSRAPLTAGLCCLSLSQAQAEIITQSIGNIDWNAAMWGDPAAPPTAGNDYFTDSTLDRVRIAADGTSSTFGGDSLTLVQGSRALIKLQNGAVATLNGDLTLDGGGISYGPNGGPHDGTLIVDNFVVTGTGADITPSGGVGTFTIDGTLRGDGDLQMLVVSGTNLRTVVFTDVGDYTGNMTVADLIRVDFNGDHSFPGSLTLLGGAVLTVDQTLTFEEGKLIANETVIPAGTYSGADLFDLGANFDEFGGTLIVERSDSDDDGLPDFYEDLIIAFDPDDDVTDYTDVTPLTDFDGDGRSDLAEFANGDLALQTDPTDPDMDDDGLLDGAETAGTNNTGVATGYGATDPKNPDSDDDGYSDGIEVRYGSDPNQETGLPGDPAPLVNGGFEAPPLDPYGVGVGAASGNVPGWSAVENDFWVLDYFETPGLHNPSLASEGFQFATAVRTAPEPDVEPVDLTGGDDASMSMRQDIDVSAFATQLDDGARTFFLDFDWRDSDAADQGIITVSFLDASDSAVGHASTFETSGSLADWTTTRLPAYPPVGTRTIRVTVEAIKIGGGTSSVRNVHFDNFIGRLVDFDSDDDQLPDPWETAYGLDIDDPSDAAVSSDGDSLTNLEEFQAGTNPTLADTDGDGVDDDAEIAQGTDPLDPASVPGGVELVDIITTRDGANQVVEVEVVFSGLVPGTSYELLRSTDLQSFTTSVDASTPDGSTASFFDSDPPAGKAFYRLSDQ